MTYKHYFILLFLGIAANVLDTYQSPFQKQHSSNQQYNEARVPVLFSWGNEGIAKILDFPDIEELKSGDSNQFIDAGIRYKQVSIFFFPVWNYDATWCGYIGSDKEYINLNYEQLNEIANGVKMTLPDAPEDGIQFWDKYGGKLVFGVLLLAFLMYSAASSKEEEKANP